MISGSAGLVMAMVSRLLSLTLRFCFPWHDKDNGSNSEDMMSEEQQSATEIVYNTLYREILTLELAPGAKLSEADTAKRLNVSRQPVREAFIMLGRLGFLAVRPKRATLVCKISEQDVLNAKFIRESLEVATVRRLSSGAFDDWNAALSENLVAQKKSLDVGDYPAFHVLDDAFHMLLCQAADLGFVWDLILEKKAYMDRARVMNIQYKQGMADAYADHIAIYDAIATGDYEAAATEVSRHLGRIEHTIKHIRSNNQAYFED